MEELKNKEIEKKLKRLDQLESSKKRQYQNQNQYIKENYKRVSITIKKEVFQELEKNTLKNESMNSYVNRLILEDIERREKENLPFF